MELLSALDITLICLGAVCLLVGLAGCIAPMLPGPPISYAGLLLLHFTERYQFTVTQLVMWAVVVLIVLLLDYFTPLIGAKKFGGSKYGNWGCVIGTVVGMFFMPFGIIVGPFAGAVIGELIANRPFNEALRTGFGSFIGFLVGTLLKFIVCIYFTYEFIAAFF